MRSLLTLVLALAVVGGCGEGGIEDHGRTVHRVPGDFATLAEAVAAAVDGDTVVLAPGTHAGGVSLAGKDLTIASEAVRQSWPQHGHRTGSEARGRQHLEADAALRRTLARVPGRDLQHHEHAVVPNPEEDLSSGDFGQITRTRGGPRVIQLGLKFRF